MIRTIWLAAFFLAAVCGLCASKVTASISQPEESIPDPTMVSFATDTLTKADRLDAVKLPAESEATLTSPPDPIAALLRKLSKSRSVVAETSVRRPSNLHASRRNVVLPRPRPKLRLSAER
jgi:hypothetical protein